MRNGRIRFSGPGGFKQPRLKTTCGDNGGRNRLGLPCGCRELFKRGKPVERGAIDRTSRCRFHGGMLAGPVTPQGKAKAVQAMRDGYERWLIAKRLSKRNSGYIAPMEADGGK